MGYKEDLRALALSVKNKLENNFIKSQLEPSAKFAIDTIYKRVKSGYGVNSDTSDNATKEKLKKLSPGYIKQRTKNPGKGEFFSPGRSNLTYTGQLLDSMDFKITKGKITIFIPASSRDDGKTNKYVAEEVRKYGRQFLTLTIPEQRILFRKIETNLRQFINLAFKKG